MHIIYTVDSCFSCSDSLIQFVFQTTRKYKSYNEKWTFKTLSISGQYIVKVTSAKKLRKIYNITCLTMFLWTSVGFGSVIKCSVCMCKLSISCIYITFHGKYKYYLCWLIWFCVYNFSCEQPDLFWTKHNYHISWNVTPTAQLALINS